VTREQLVYRTGAAPGTPPERIGLESPGSTVALIVGEVVEEHVQVVNPADRNFIAVVVPLAAGMEPLNPRLETAPPEAKPAGTLTLTPTYAAYLDDQVAFYFNAAQRHLRLLLPHPRSDPGRLHPAARQSRDVRLQPGRHQRRRNGSVMRSGRRAVGPRPRDTMAGHVVRHDGRTPWSSCPPSSTCPRPFDCREQG
jgi:hypothetical protein